VSSTNHLDSSLCNLLQSPVTSSLLGPNNLVKSIWYNRIKY
jgi:hypothetical protein